MEYDTQKLIELAFAAYRVNKGYEKQTRRYSESQPTTFSNKELIVYTVTKNSGNSFVPSDFEPIVVTEEDLQAKESADKHMRRYSMLALGKLSNFENDIFTAYSNEKTSLSRAGFIAYLPEFVKRELVEKTYKARLKTEFAESSHINLHKIENSTVEILKMIPLREYDVNLYIGAVGSDLVSFSNKGLLDINGVYQISARIKGHDVERDTALKMTRLNYVKLKKVNN